jgi:hypothetical protein
MRRKLEIWGGREREREHFLAENQRGETLKIQWERENEFCK